MPEIRYSISLDETTVKYLNELAALNTHGGAAGIVARTLIEEGIRAAIRDGFIKARCGKESADA